MTSEEAFGLAKSIRERIKKEAKDLEEWTELHNKNPELAQLVADIEDILTTWAYRIIARIEASVSE